MSGPLKNARIKLSDSESRMQSPQASASKGMKYKTFTEAKLPLANRAKPFFLRNRSTAPTEKAYRNPFASLRITGEFSAGASAIKARRPKACSRNTERMTSTEARMRSGGAKNLKKKKNHFT